MRDRPRMLLAVGLLGCGTLAAMLAVPGMAPARHGVAPPLPGVVPAPERGIVPPAAPEQLLGPEPRRTLGRPPLAGAGVPAVQPARVHRVHLPAPVLAWSPVSAPRIPSDAPPRLFDPSPSTGRRMGAPRLATPGALPDGYRFHYADAYRGWPVQPLHGPHTLHGAFNDPREGGYHFGVDIPVDDSRPATLAPPGMSHRIFAVESGVMHYTQPREMASNCNDRRFQVGQFSYWHASPALPEGAPVRAGEMIGWTCLNEWHVHLSEWALVNGQRTWVNPLHPGGKLQPYVDDAKPVIRAVYAYGPPDAAWAPAASSEAAGSDGALTQTFDNLHGAVDLRAWIDDSQGRVALDHHSAAAISPYRVWMQIRRIDNEAIVARRDVWRSDILLTGRERFFAHYAARSRPPLSDALCAEATDCSGRLFYHLLVSGEHYLWDTRTVGDGAYLLSIRASDIAGNEAERSVVLTIRN